MKARAMEDLKAQANGAESQRYQHGSATTAAVLELNCNRARLALTEWDLKEGTFSLGCALRRASGEGRRLVTRLRLDRQEVSVRHDRESVLDRSGLYTTRTRIYWARPSFGTE